MNISVISHFLHCNIVLFLYLFNVGWLATNDTLWGFMNMLNAQNLGLVQGRKPTGQSDGLLRNTNK